MGRFITLITDFGLSDHYVGVMKGVIYSINPEAKIIDISHEVPRFNIRAAAYLLKASWSYFPLNTIHLSIVDPGVGSDRKGVLLERGGHYFIAPDNGVLSLLLDDPSLYKAYQILNPDYMLPWLSTTFHGRDIFAPCAGHLSKGVPIEDFGPGIEGLVRLELGPRIKEGEIIGEIIYIDHFGNLVSNITRDLVPPLRSIVIEINGCRINEISRFYSECKAGEVLALFGSSNHLEVSVNSASARELLGVREGEEIVIRMNR